MQCSVSALQSRRQTQTSIHASVKPDCFLGAILHIQLDSARLGVVALSNGDKVEGGVWSANSNVLQVHYPSRRWMRNPLDDPPCCAKCQRMENFAAQMSSVVLFQFRHTFSAAPHRILYTGISTDLNNMVRKFRIQ